MDNKLLAKDWLLHALPNPHMEIEIGPADITLSISQESRKFLDFMKDNGIEYEEPDLILCG